MTEFLEAALAVCLRLMKFLNQHQLPLTLTLALLALTLALLAQILALLDAAWYIPVCCPAP